MFPVHHRLRPSRHGGDAAVRTFVRPEGGRNTLDREINERSRTVTHSERSLKKHSAATRLENITTNVVRNRYGTKTLNHLSVA